MSAPRRPYVRANHARIMAEAKWRAHALRRAAESDWLDALARRLRAFARAVTRLYAPRPRRQLEA